MHLVTKPETVPTSAIPMGAAPGPRAAATAIAAALLPTVAAALRLGIAVAGPQLVVARGAVLRLIPVTAVRVAPGACAAFSKSGANAGAILARATTARSAITAVITVVTAAGMTAGTAAAVLPVVSTALRLSPWCSPHGLLLVSPARTCTWWP